jgi:hypothetical protein
MDFLLSRATYITRKIQHIGMPYTPQGLFKLAFSHAPLTHRAHRAPTNANTAALFMFRLARNARAYSFPRLIGFCALWVCISSNSK